MASISSEVSHIVQREAFDFLDAPVRRLTQSDTPFAFATTLIDEALPGVEDVVKSVKATMYHL